MATKKDLEFEANARRKEEARRAKAAGAVRITPPKEINLKGPANPLAGSGRTGGFSAQDAVDIGGVIPRARTRVGETPAAPPPGQLDPAITGVIQRDPAVSTERPETPPADTAPVAGSPEALRNTFLGQHGVTPEVQAQDPRVFDAEGTGRFQRRQRIGAGGQDFVNLGNFETEGGPNIFGRANEEGGPINTFVGAGLRDPSNPSTVVGQGAANAGGRFAESFRGTDVNPELQAGIDAFKLRAASGGNLRAGDRQFRGGAASGGTDNTLRQINRINSRADKAFQDALSQGMNTKAAARIAGSIRDSATQVNFQDRTRATERNTAATIDSQKEIASLRNLSARETLDAEQARALDDASFEDLKGLSFTENPETGAMEFNQQKFSESLFAAGGRDALSGFSGSTKHALFRQGSNVTKFISNANKFLASEGKRVDNIGDLLKGAQLTTSGKLSQTHTTFMEALRDKNISIGDIFGETITLGDGTLLPLAELLGEDAAQFTNEERAALIEIIPED